MSSLITSHGTELGGAEGPSSPPAKAGGRPGTIALLALLGVPIAVAINFGWSFLMQTSAAMDTLERVTGWSAVLRELPAVALVLTPILLGLAFGVRSARLGSRRGIVAVVLHSALLILVLAAYLETGLAARATVAAIILPALAACVYIGWRAPAAGPAERGTAHRLRLAALIAVGGIVCAAAWLSAAQLSLSSHAGAFPRATVPGGGDVRTVTLTADLPSTYYIYVEGNAIATLDELAVRVTDPAGQVVPVAAVASQPAYLRDFRGGHVLGSFEASTAGAYQVAATGTLPGVTAPFAPSNPYGDFAVGHKVTDWMRPHEWGSAALLVLAILAGAILAVVTPARARRQ